MRHSKQTNSRKAPTSDGNAIMTKKTKKSRGGGGGGADDSAEDGSTPEKRKFRAEYDDLGVYFYQAYREEIADYALEHQRFGGPHFKTERMTWIKPSFAWMLYRSGYASKHNSRILKIKLSHDAVASLLSQCTWGRGEGGLPGRIQWDPERDLYEGDPEKREPRKIPTGDRAIQIGLGGVLAKEYVESVVSIEDVTLLARRVGEAHERGLMDEELTKEMPDERPYVPYCPRKVLRALGMEA